MSVKFLKAKKLYDSSVCMRGLNLLGHAQILELDIGSLCGGHGKCGKDLLVLGPDEQKKVNPPSEIEKHQLSKEDLARGVRLACQCFPNVDGLTILVESN